MYIEIPDMNRERKITKTQDLETCMYIISNREKKSNQLLLPANFAIFFSSPGKSDVHIAATSSSSGKWKAPRANTFYFGIKLFNLFIQYPLKLSVNIYRSEE